MNDEHHGLGGSYIVDPKTGKRSLVERTAEAATAPIETPEATPPVEKTAKKEG